MLTWRVFVIVADAPRVLAIQKNKRTGEHEVSYPVLGAPPNATAVPTHFFKVVLGEHRGKRAFAAAGFVLPNKVIPENKDLLDFQAPLDVIEKQAGLLFFDKVCVNSRWLCEHWYSCRL